MEHIETIELGSSQSSITFSSIPQDYDDLKILLSLRGTATNTSFVQGRININGGNDNTTNILLQGTGSSINNASVGGFIGQVNIGQSTSDTFTNWSLYISNYSSTTVKKSISGDAVSENNATLGYQVLTANLYDSTTAITELLFNLSVGGDFAANSSISLYGISAGGDGTVTTS